MRYHIDFLHLPSWINLAGTDLLLQQCVHIEDGCMLAARELDSLDIVYGQRLKSGLCRSILHT